MADLPVKETTIDGVVYRVKLLGGRDAFHASARAAAALAGTIKPDEFEWLREKFADSTMVGIVDTAGDGQTRFVSLSSVFDEHFRGGPEVRARMLKWYHYSIEANFGPLADVVRGILGYLMARLKSISPKIVPGSSGASSSSPG